VDRLAVIVSQMTPDIFTPTSFSLRAFLFFVFCFLYMAMICLYICFIMIIDIVYLVSEMDVYL